MAPSMTEITPLIRNNEWKREISIGHQDDDDVTIARTSRLRKYGLLLAVILLTGTAVIGGVSGTFSAETAGFYRSRNIKKYLAERKRAYREYKKRHYEKYAAHKTHKHTTPERHHHSSPTPEKHPQSSPTPAKTPPVKTTGKPGDTQTDGYGIVPKLILVWAVVLVLAVVC